MTDTQFAACVREVPAYADIDAYVSDLALSSMWGDGEDEDIPAQRLDDLCIPACCCSALRDC